MLYGGVYKLKLGSFGIASDEVGITHINYLENIDKSMLDSFKKLRNNALSDEMAKQLQEYFDKKRQSFDIALSLNGSKFQKRVWQSLCQIPYGQIRSYKELAKSIGNENASRAVGNANNKNPIMIVIPCHRIIGSDKSLVGYAYGLELKKMLLELEGVRLD